MQRCVIFDLDGTTCDIRHRLHHLEHDPKDWVAFHDAMVDDTPNEPIVWLAKLIASAAGHGDILEDFGVVGPHALVIVTARHEDYRVQTETWLREHGIHYARLYMRANDDRRPDAEVKADILMQMTQDGYEPFLVIDDRPEVVEMWRDWGLVCLQCAPDEPKQRLAGKHLLTLLVGPAGAGKSTYAREHYGEHEIVSTDRIREQQGWGHSPEDLAATFRLARSLVRARVENGLHTVVDATNLKQKDRLAFIRACPRGIVVHYVLLDRDYDEKAKCVTGHRPAAVIDRHHRTFRNTTLVDVKTADGLGNVVVVDRRQAR